MAIMMKSLKKMSGILAVLLAGAIFLNNESIVSALAKANEGSVLSVSLNNEAAGGPAVDSGGSGNGSGTESGSGGSGTESGSGGGGSSSDGSGTENGSGGSGTENGNGSSGAGDSAGESGTENGSGTGSSGAGDSAGGSGTENGSGTGSSGAGDSAGGSGTENGSGTGNNGAGGSAGGSGTENGTGSSGDGGSAGGNGTENGNGNGTGSNGTGGSGTENGGGNGSGDGTSPDGSGAEGNGSIGGSGIEGNGNTGEDEEDVPGEETGTEHLHIYEATEGKLLCTICGIEQPEEDIAEAGDGDNGLPSIPPCIEGKEHEYEELLAEDGSVAGYLCVFCAREIDADGFETESASLHGHIWERKEGILLPQCTGCGREYHDCDAEEGYGIHVFERIQTEGETDRYRCMMCGEEKDTLEAFDITAEQFMELTGIVPLEFTYEGETSSIPVTIAELRKAEAEGAYKDKSFLVTRIADIIALQKLNEDGFEFEGYTIRFGAREYEGGSAGGEITTWDLTKIKDGDFNGWGTEAHPFKGTLTSYYIASSLRFKTKVPMLNYVMAGAEVSNLQINAEITSAGEPVGIIAAHVVPSANAASSDEYKQVKLSDLSLSGTVTNDTGAAGILFGEAVNSSAGALQFNYTEGSISLGAAVTAEYAGGIVGRTEGNVEIYQTSLFPAGRITGRGSAVESGSAAAAGGAGMLVGMMAASTGSDGSVYAGRLYLDASKANTVSAEVDGSGICGGLAGIMQQGAILQSPAGAGTRETLTIAGSVKGDTAGGLAGHCEKTQMELDNIAVTASVTGRSRYAGGLIGHYYGDAEGDVAGDYQSVNHIRVTGAVYGYRGAGGVAGYMEASNYRIGTADTADCVTVSGPVSAHEGGGVAVGGVIGLAEGQYIEVYHALISGGLNAAQSLGGIIGTVGDGTAKTVVKVTDASVRSALAAGADNRVQGGIYGSVRAKSMAALDGRIDTAGISINNTTAKRGHIAGEQSQALVYFETGCSYDRPEGKAWVDDIGVYGGVYRNGTWGESADIISYAAKDVVGTVEKPGLTEWILDSEADVIRLAICLNSDLNFASASFDSNKNYMLGWGTYKLKSDSGELNLEGAGIYSLNANNKTNESFDGTFTGEEGAKIRLKLGSLVTYQSNISLFTAVGDFATFKNFTVDREILYAKDMAAGIAAQALGNVTVENVDMEVRITGNKQNSSYVYGGMFGEYLEQNGATLIVRNSKIGGSITIDQSGITSEDQRQYAGGLTAKYRKTDGAGIPETTLEINGLDIAIKITSNSPFVSGMITQINTGEIVGEKRDTVTLRLDNITIKNGASLDILAANTTGGWLGREWYGIKPYENGTDTYSVKALKIGEGGTAAEGPFYFSNGAFGGLVHTVAGRIRLNNIAVNNANFVANSTAGYNGLLFWQGHNALIEIENYTIAGYGMCENTVDYDLTGRMVTIGGSGSGKDNFSEIVGNNIGKTAAGVDDYKSGGIVNLISNGFSTDHTAYRNRLMNATARSNKARYYYNLFGTSLSGSGFLSGRELDAANIVIENADQMMVWHLTRYMNASVKRYLNPYYKGDDAARAENAANSGNVTLNGRIDLAGKSYYPTYISGMTVSGTGNARIVFHGGEISAKTSGAKAPFDTNEHYMMQSGLFISQDGTVTVQGDDNFLTLEGTVSDAAGNTGALFSRRISGNKNIYRIRLNNLFVYNPSGNQYHGRGLLIGNVNDNTNLDISWIETVYAPGSKNAASALIGTVGSRTAKKINIDFTNIKVDDKAGGIFTAAILIDYFDYTDSTEENEGRVRYLFTEEAYKGTNGSGKQKAPFTGGVHGDNNYSGIGSYVTIGNELKDGVEYWNVDYGPEKGNTKLPGTAIEWEAATEAEWNNYLPYVCAADARKDIEVNPKNVSILEGCGTYEDPYQISQVRQVLALDRYLKNPRDAKYLEDWQIVKTGKKHGDAGGICDKNHTDDLADIATYGDADFPAQNELRQAYYMITADIDLSSLSTSTDRNIAQEFVGLGTKEMPFSGVIVGKKADGNVPVITLSRKQWDNSCTNFGLIQYAKGAVVKDIVIKSSSETEGTLTGVINVTQDGGSVMACIMGGDNIIDNVKVENTLAAGNALAAVGGYAGTVEQGSLLLRNLSEDRLSGFNVGTLDTGTGTLNAFDTAAQENYPYVSGMVGRVENGFVIYENKDAVSGKVLPHDALAIDGIYRHGAIPLSKTYDILVESRLKEGLAAGKIPITKAGDDFSCEIKNAEQLQIVSMAINSDAFSIYYDGGGYDKLAVCRKADYSEVGAVMGVSAEYRRATGKDDKVYWYPYIYQYFHFDGSEAEDSDRAAGTGFYATLDGYTSGTEAAYRSKLNAVTKEITARMNYRLAHDGTKDMTEVDYDLSAYGHAFRGLGATYRVFERDEEAVNLNVRPAADNVYSDFRANFDGGGATVKAVMVNDYDRAIHTVALFNDLVDTSAVNAYSIKNLVVTGSFVNYVEGRNASSGGNANYSGDRAAAVIGLMKRPWTIEGITALDVRVSSKGHAGGIVAWIDPAGAGKDYMLKDCRLLSERKDNASLIHTVGGSSGGILGVMAPVADNREITGLSLRLENCLVQGRKDTVANEIVYVSVRNDGKVDGLGGNDQERNARGRSGAVIGHVGKRSNYTQRLQIGLTITGDVSGEEVKYAYVSGGDSTGGVLGEYYGWRIVTGYKNVTIQDITVSDSRIESKNRNEMGEYSFGIGGIIGKLQRAANCSVQNTGVKNTDIVSLFSGGMDMNAGGIIGFCYSDSQVTLDKVAVTGELPAGTAGVPKPAYRITAGNAHAGGLIGSCGLIKGKSTVTMKECLVKGMEISSDNRSGDDVSKDKASGTSDSRAGGMVGTVANAEWKLVRPDAPDAYNEVKACVIRTGRNSAAGIAGAVTSNTAVDFEAVRVSGCVIGSNGRIAAINECGHGGIIGKLMSGMVNQRFKDIIVDSSYIYGKYAGGLTGYVEENQRLGNIWEKAGDELIVRNSRILGYHAGGALGIDKSGKEAFTHVVIMDNTITALRNDTNEYSAAGGFCGRKEILSADNNLDYIKISGNRILGGNAKADEAGCAGGMFGYVNAGNYLYAYRPELTDNCIGYYAADRAEDMLSKETEGQLELLTEAMDRAADGTGTEVSIWKQGLLGLNKVKELPSGLKEEDIGDYALLFGNLAGAYGGGSHVYFLAPQIAYTDAYGDKVRPVTDVGAAAVQTAGDKLLSYPYAYRQNIHVIYHEPDTGGANAAAALWGSGAGDKDRLFTQINAGAVLEEYHSAVNGDDTDSLLDAYRLKLSDDTGNTVPDIWHKVYQDTAGVYRSPLTVMDGTSRETLPMIVIDTQYGTADQLMTSVLAVLTGAGGVHNSGEKNRDDRYDAGLANLVSGITVTPMKVEDGVIKAGAGSASIRCAKQNNRIEISYAGYDMALDNGDGSFSMLSLTFGQNGYTSINGTGVTSSRIVLNIPIFVIERLTIDTHLKIVEGEVYNVDNAKEKGLCTAPLLANNSSYTLYTEYIYGEARNKYSTDASPIQVDKTIGMTYTDEVGNVKRDNFWKGTKLTLIDVCDANKVYYYTVTGEETEALRYADFKDAKGNPYVNKPIHGSEGMELHRGSDDRFVTEDAEKINGEYRDKTYEYEDVAVERFLIVVDTSQVEENLKLNTRDIRDYAITPNLSEEVLKRTTLSEHTSLQITRQPGLAISMIKSGAESCRIEGKIEDSDKVTVDGAFRIEGDTAYWARVMTNQAATIDSANHYKYLELGIYLTDKNGNRVRLPDNTNVTIGGSRTEPLAEETIPEKPLGPYVNQNAVYFYKDGGLTFPLDELKGLIQEEMKENGGRTNGVITMKSQTVLSFVNADLSDYTEDGYVVHLELLRVEEPDYPAGGELIDSYEDTCPAARKTDLACALEPKELLQLGINTYDRQTPMPHKIEFDFKLDFNGVLSNNETANGELAAKYYTVTYRILEKTNRNGTPAYVPYSGDMLTLELSEAPEGESLVKGPSSVGGEKNSAYVSYRFKLGEIKAGTDRTSEGVIIRKLNLTVKDAEKMNLSNYKIQASVMVSDAPQNDIDAVVNGSLSDFFVFTVAKLKTDLDY